MNSKWQIHRVGLINFWYYDEEEFYFLDGRMLLRGSNGSGKSVTMQSFIPLLLDGNMRPERLDPFGSRARKMDNYLLEEGDARDERTGYLYMEFKRLESDQYGTIGIGLRARKNKKLESWYFCITDGRRIGKDMNLYKDVGNKIPYSRMELRHKIGEGGQVMDSQAEYAQCVNRLFFGFDTMEAYKEMLDLLIQLRTPKLSKDFKPTIINDILSNSLQTLSEDDLRPMSEAIENMDSLKTNLDGIKNARRAAAQIDRVYDQYNQKVLFEKASAYVQADTAKTQGEKKAVQLEENLSEARQGLKEAVASYEQLLREEQVLAQEKQSLSQSDAARLKESEQELLTQLEESRKSLDQKKHQEDEKRERCVEEEGRLRSRTEKNDSCLAEMEACLETMGEALEDIPFDEYAFMKQDILEHPEQSYAYESHEKLLDIYESRVEKGIEILEQEHGCRTQYDMLLKELDDCRTGCDQAQKQVMAYEGVLHEIRGEFTEQVYQWEAGNEELKIKAETMQALTRMVENYAYGMDFGEITGLLRPDYYRKESSLQKTLSTQEQELEVLQEKIKEEQERLLLWESQTDPEPEQPSWVMENRKKLDEAGIPWVQFYKMIDFDHISDEEQAGRIEEALMNMGLLDALVIPSEYRTQVLAMAQGTCDRYLFSDVSAAGENLLEIFSPDQENSDMFTYQNMLHVLSAIGWENHQGNTWIEKNGYYRIGILEGTVTGQYKARYIGAAARERFRQEKIKEITAVLEQYRALRDEKQTQIHAMEGRLSALFREWEQFPKGDDLAVAAKSCAQARHEYELALAQVERKKQAEADMRARLEQLWLKAKEICAPVYLTVRLDIFKAAAVQLKLYRNELMKLRIGHAAYENGLADAARIKDRLEELAQDMDDILYDKNRMEQAVGKLTMQLDSVHRQLELTDYEQIRDRLNACITRLNQLPSEREAAVSRRTGLEKDIEKYEEASRNHTAQLQLLQQEFKSRKAAFCEEYHLGYVYEKVSEEQPPAANVREDAALKDAQHVVRAFSGTWGNKTVGDILGNLQEVFHQNRGELSEYHMTLGSCEGGRADIMAKYRGSSVNFKSLLKRLDQDIEEQTKILDDRDRELFEDILANTISKKIRGKIQSSKRWVERMNQLMASMHTSSGLKLSLRWKNRRAENEEQLDTKALVELLQKDVQIMLPEDVDRLTGHFRSKIQEARKISGQEQLSVSFHGVIREVLDYRQWFEFQLECQKPGENKKELTDRVFFTFSGGEKAMAMYVPLFSAVVAKYAGARPDAPRLISLDEAFAGVDEMNIRDMFRLMVEFDFNFMINSQILWGDYETVPALAIYQLVRPENARFVTVIHYIWNGKELKFTNDTSEDEDE